MPAAETALAWQRRSEKALIGIAVLIILGFLAKNLLGGFTGSPPLVCVRDQRVAVVDRSGAEEASFDVGGPVEAAVPSPDGRLIAVTATRGRQSLVFLDMEGEEVARYDGFAGPRWSPDASRVLALDTNDRLCLISPRDGEDVAELAGTCEWSGAYSWSPDGDYIAYADTDRSNISVVDLDEPRAPYAAGDDEFAPDFAVWTGDHELLVPLDDALVTFDCESRETAVVIDVGDSSGPDWFDGVVLAAAIPQAEVHIGLIGDSMSPCFSSDLGRDDVDVFRFSAQEGVDYGFWLDGREADLALLGEDGQPVAADSRRGLQGDSQYVQWRCSRAGTYAVRVAAPRDGSPGPYSLYAVTDLAAGRPTGGPERRVLVPNVPIEAYLSYANDDDISGDMIAHRYVYNGPPGSEVVVDLMSSDFDAYLYAFDYFTSDVDQAIARDDDGGAGYNSRMTVAVPSDGSLDIVAASPFSDPEGAYTIVVHSGAGGGPDVPDDIEDAPQVFPQPGGVWFLSGAASEVQAAFDDLLRGRSIGLEGGARIVFVHPGANAVRAAVSPDGSSLAVAFSAPLGDGDDAGLMLAVLGMRGEVTTTEVTRDRGASPDPMVVEWAADSSHVAVAADGAAWVCHVSGDARPAQVARSSVGSLSWGQLWPNAVTVY